MQLSCQCDAPDGDLRRKTKRTIRMANRARANSTEPLLLGPSRNGQVTRATVTIVRGFVDAGCMAIDLGVVLTVLLLVGFLPPRLAWRLLQPAMLFLLLFGIEPNGRLRVVSNRRKTEPKPGWTVIALVPPPQAQAPAARAAA